MKPLPLKQLNKPAKTPSKFTNLDELETFLKTAQSCSLEKENLSNILQIINYLKKKGRRYSSMIRDFQSRIDALAEEELDFDSMSTNSESQSTQASSQMVIPKLNMAKIWDPKEVQTLSQRGRKVVNLET